MDDVFEFAQVFLAPDICNRLDEEDRKNMEDTGVLIKNGPPRPYLEGIWGQLEQICTFLRRKYRPSQSTRNTDDHTIITNEAAPEGKTLDDIDGIKDSGEGHSPAPNLDLGEHGRVNCDSNCELDKDIEDITAKVSAILMDRDGDHGISSNRPRDDQVQPKTLESTMQVGLEVNPQTSQKLNTEHHIKCAAISEKPKDRFTLQEITPPPLSPELSDECHPLGDNFTTLKYDERVPGDAERQTTNTIKATEASSQDAVLTTPESTVENDSPGVVDAPKNQNVDPAGYSTTEEEQHKRRITKVAHESESDTPPETLGPHAVVSKPPRTMRLKLKPIFDDSSKLIKENTHCIKALKNVLEQSDITFPPLDDNPTACTALSTEELNHPKKDTCKHVMSPDMPNSSLAKNESSSLPSGCSTRRPKELSNQSGDEGPKMKLNGDPGTFSDETKVKAAIAKDDAEKDHDAGTANVRTVTGPDPVEQRYHGQDANNEISASDDSISSIDISDDEGSVESKDSLAKRLIMPCAFYEQIREPMAAEFATCSSKFGVKVKYEKIEGRYGMCLLKGRKEDVCKITRWIETMVKKTNKETTSFERDDTQFSTTFIGILEKEVEYIEERCKSLIPFQNKAEKAGFPGNQDLQKSTERKQEQELESSHGEQLDNTLDVQPHIPIEKPTTASYVTGNGIKIHIFMADITHLMVGAVVNAANDRLKLGDGVAGAIEKAAGPGLQKECDRFISNTRVLQTSNVYRSAAYDMLCQCIIHVVGPQWDKYKDKKQAVEMLHQSFYHCLEAATDQPSIAIPPVGSGIFGCPIPAVAERMFQSVMKFVSKAGSETQLKDILLVDINPDVLKLLKIKFNQAVKEGKITASTPECDRFLLEKDEEQDCRLEGDNATEIESMEIDDESQLEALSQATVTGQNEMMKNNCYRQTGNSECSKTAMETPEKKQMRPFETIDRVEPSSESKESNAATRKIEDCAICMEIPVNRIELPCKHVFCKQCIDKWFVNKPTCPSCGFIHGQLRGNQPDGTMKVTRLRESPAGFPAGTGTIIIHYYFPGGLQKDNHPDPGRRYSSTCRTAYLPDNEEGNHVLGLLTRAFDAKLIFTIGTSSTSGRDGQITWNDIHHKSSMTGGQESFGFPDPTYLSRVKEELAAKGIK